MEKLHYLYSYLDLAGTFVFAISGATAARKRNLDLFGISAIAFVVACGGGIIRDLCIGAIPPAGLTNWRYLVASIMATGLTVSLFSVVQRLYRPVLLFDAVGLALFAVTGAQKALAFGYDGEMAVLLGVTTAVGGGVIRDIMLNRVPVILQKEIYASAALLGAGIVVLGHHFNWDKGGWVSIIALLVCFILRILALHFRWNLPTPSDNNNDSEE